MGDKHPLIKGSERARHMNRVVRGLVASIGLVTLAACAQPAMDDITEITVERDCTGCTSGTVLVNGMTPHDARLARAWGVGQAADLLRRALVLLADHELNVSTFAARVAASSGASLQHVTLAALCTLQGPKHGLAATAAYDLLTYALRPGISPQQALRESTRQHGHLPGFGHRLYPHGDPRAGHLLRALEAAQLQPHLSSLTTELGRVAYAETGEQPNIDLALAALLHTLGRPAQDTLALFALGRASGWLAHALETLSSGQLIRPRARYVGLT